MSKGVTSPFKSTLLLYLNTNKAAETIITGILMDFSFNQENINKNRQRLQTL